MADNNGFKKTATMPGNERKCPNCGGTLTYNPGARKLFCSLCGKYKDITKGTTEEHREINASSFHATTAELN